MHSICKELVLKLECRPCNFLCIGKNVKETEIIHKKSVSEGELSLSGASALFIFMRILERKASQLFFSAVAR